jgi:hypothetical protein
MPPWGLNRMILQPALQQRVASSCHLQRGYYQRNSLCNRGIPPAVFAYVRRGSLARCRTQEKCARAGAFILLHLHTSPLDVVVGHAACRLLYAILAASGAIYARWRIRTSEKSPSTHSGE